MFSSVYYNLRTVYWGWNGYFDAMEESADLLMTPLRIGVGWGDLYITMHKHTYHSRIGHFSTIWNNAYAGINACNKLLEQELVKASGTSVAQLRATVPYIITCCLKCFEIFRWKQPIPYPKVISRSNRLPRRYSISSNRN
ncbi:MAG: hypothetical protein LBU37_10970 [Tannerellaceae bacterium]|nr:hypothetical protein [Tannerellaceae bacterium]